MKITKTRLRQLIKEEARKFSEGAMAGHYENPDKNKATKAMGLLSRLRSLTTEEWSPEAGATFDALLALLQEIEQDHENNS